VKYFDWDEEKNRRLKEERGIGFEDVLLALQEERLITIFRHPNQKKYPNQEIFVIEVNSYIYIIPFVEDQEKIFLKTIFPSRKLTKKYLE